MHAHATVKPAIHACRRAPLFAGIAAALGALLASPAMAQQPAAPAEPAEQRSPRSDEARELSKIVVTANKREQDIREVPSAISVIGDQQIENVNATQLTDYANYVPGLQVASDGTPGQTRASMRGIAPLSSGATVGTYIDETPVGSSGLYQAATILMLDLLPYDIERVEVLRGPQGTLYGAGSMGGLFKYVLQQPNLSYTELRAGGGVSSVSGGGTGHNVRFGANLPLVEDKLGLRVSYARNDLPGYIDNSVTGEKDINTASQDSLRAALRWQGDSVSVDLSAMRQSIDADNNASVSLNAETGKPLGNDLSHRVFVDSPFTKDIDHYAATVEWDLGWGSFTSATGYSDVETRRRQDTTIDYGRFTDLQLGLPDPGAAYFDSDFSFTQLTQEFRLASDESAPLEWLIGTFYSREKAENRQHIELTQLDGTALAPPMDAMADLATLRLPTEFREKAVFGNISYSFTDRFKLGAGVRYARNDQEFSQIVDSGLLLPVGTTPNSSDESVFTWSLTPQYQLSEDTMLYGKIATGYQPGGPNVKLPGVPDQVDSSTLTSYELGSKALLADNRLQVDVALFRIDWKDIQVAAFFEGNTGLINGGEATSQGVELASLFRVNPNFDIGFNATYTDAELSDDFPTMLMPSDPYLVQLNSGLKGDRMPFAPKFSAAVTGDYYFPVGSWMANVGGGLRWTGSRVVGTTERQLITDPSTTPATILQTQITPPLELGSYAALDLYAGLSRDHWTVRAYVKNATDERAYSTISRRMNQLTGEIEELNGVPIQPRTVGIELDYRF